MKIIVITVIKKTKKLTRRIPTFTAQVLLVRHPNENNILDAKPGKRRIFMNDTPLSIIKATEIVVVMF